MVTQSLAVMATHRPILPPPIIETILLIHTRMYAWRMQIRRPGLAMEALASPNCRLQIINRSPLIFSVCVCVCVCVCFFFWLISPDMCGTQSCARSVTFTEELQVRC